MAKERRVVSSPLPATKKADFRVDIPLPSMLSLECSSSFPWSPAEVVCLGYVPGTGPLSGL
jgi:hypothetical protein